MHPPPLIRLTMNEQIEQILMTLGILREAFWICPRCNFLVDRPGQCSSCSTEELEYILVIKMLLLDKPQEESNETQHWPRTVP
jgi:hypothetical protein